MSNFIINFFFFFFVSFFYSQNKSIVKGETSQIYNGKKIYYSFRDVDKVIVDSTIIEKGKFYLKIENKYPTGIFIYSNNKTISTEIDSYFFFIEKGESKLFLDYSDFSKTEVEQNLAQKDYIKLKNFTKEIDLLLKENSKRVSTLKKNLDVVKDQKLKSLALRESDSLTYLLYDREIMENLSFINQNPDSFVSLDRMFFILGVKDGRAKYKIVRPIFDKMSERVKSNELGIFLEKKLKNIEYSSLDNFAINFLAKDLEGREFSLADFKGKNFVLLDFWASWCVPCKLELPSLRLINEKYKDKGLIIISISQDKDFSTWRKTIKKEKMDLWINTFLYEDNKKIILNNYAVQAIPVKVLIDKKGKIIGRWTGYSEQQSLEMEKLISTIVE